MIAILDIMGPDVKTMIVELSEIVQTMEIVLRLLLANVFKDTKEWIVLFLIVLSKMIVLEVEIALQ